MNLPGVPGVYLFKDEAGRVVYVGKAKSLAQRVRQYLVPDADPWRNELMNQARDLDTVMTSSEVEALLLESTLIRQHRPRFNILLTDDKSFPYVKLSVQEEFPRLSVTRRVLDDGARYLGPFTDVKSLRRTLREIRRIFPVRTCRDFEEHRRANRPCLYFHIRRCTGPCTTRTRVAPAEYRALIDQLLWFLTGRDTELLERLRTEMAEAAETKRYELAALRRDQIALLENVRRPQDMVRGRGRERASDVLGVARHGGGAAVTAILVRGGRVVGKETRVLGGAGRGNPQAILESFLAQHYLAGRDLPNRIWVAELPAGAEVIAEALTRAAGHQVQIRVAHRGRGARLVRTAERNAAHALEDADARRAGRRARFGTDVLELQRALGLESPPYRMICFDISNLGAEGAVAAIVASENGQARRGLYRRMRIRGPGPDDVGMIREAVQRYWTRVESDELPRPDLVVVDGGVGQVQAARAALDDVATGRVALIGLAKREETVVRESGGPLRMSRRSPALRALQRLRDEAHRFGIAYHRNLRSRARITSELDRVRGIGPARRARLLHAFGSITALRAASAADIAVRARIPMSLAERVVAELSTVAQTHDAPERRAGGE